MNPEVLFKITFTLPSNSSGETQSYLTIGDANNVNEALQKVCQRFYKQNKDPYWKEIKIEVIEGELLK